MRLLSPMALILSFIIMAAGCYSSTLTHGIPNFQTVDTDLFRGGQPDQEGMFYLKSLEVKTIIELNGDAPELDTLEMNVIPIHLSGFFMPSESNMAEIETLLESAPRPIFIHCKEGRDRTGLAIAIYRVQAEAWLRHGAYDEWTQYGRHLTDWFLEAYFWNHTK